MSVETGAALARLLVALLIGLLIGLDRERAELRKAREEYAGVRTFPLIAVAGCVPVLIWDVTGPLLLGLSFAAVAAITSIAYFRLSAGGYVGATTEVAAIATFLLGAMAGAGELVVAGAAGVAVALLLVAKPRLEAVSRALTEAELAAVLELAVISVIVLPLLPSRGYGPWGLWNPREIWWVVVLVAGLSFAGFVAVRLLGERRGLAVTGAVGGLVSSTAVTLAMAERSRVEGSEPNPAAAAAVLASSVMAARMALLAGAIDRGVLARLVPVLAAMFLVGLAAARLIVRQPGQIPAVASGHIRNPFKLTSALLFAALYAGVLVLARAAGDYLGSGGLVAAAVVSSVADVDAVTIAYTRLGPGTDEWRLVAAAISVAAVMNTLVKLSFGLVRGAGRFRLYLALGLGAMALAGTVTGLVVYLR
ncbi:MAG TPA: DUF4010 domain-containing protein [Gemmatimonadales bacterium]|nr:DUF4010 domain-containing protein [Gemmatimonadales bacterium]